MAVYDRYLLLLEVYIALAAPAVLFVDAPHGKFRNQSRLFRSGFLPGRFGWVLMELVAPTTFVYGLILNEGFGHVQWNPRIVVLCMFYLIHYINRSLIGPLIFAPHIAPMHVSVLISAIVFNYLNAMGMSGYLVSLSKGNERASTTLAFVAGLGLWAFGLYGNVFHDNILYELRRQKLRTSSAPQQGNENSEVSRDGYRIPFGGLFRFISCPNYFCEWIEWTGYAIACGPSARPMIAFVVAEILFMFPRARSTHKWYQKTFSSYPPQRKAVIPFVA
ncbi:steroid reductase [Schizosaccharomyces japonicus yFS275]|uniref:Steroid reductase n=1 Tax=Schizosaccharomyces japonicus (strain yFS275 / FY16936) TaxID=402676 RepID=B6K227_SCHJY|nr:steroid reductase [Schizosaccharomyces japonicus yFS275]EEB07208.1 steroid reductase [Schizosaccharomyces japonicus yFS275]